jgi:hypothetical protein
MLWLTVFASLFTVLATTYRELGQEEEELLVVHEVDQEPVNSGGLLQRSMTMRNK